MLPDTQAKIPKVNTMIADVPAAKPSIPSVKLAPFETAVIIKITTKTNTIHAYFSKPRMDPSDQIGVIKFI